MSVVHVHVTYERCRSRKGVPVAIFPCSKVMLDDTPVLISCAIDALQARAEMAHEGQPEMQMPSRNSRDYVLVPKGRSETVEAMRGGDYDGGPLYLFELVDAA